MPKQQKQQQQQYRMTLEDAIEDYQNGLLTAKGALAAWVRIKLAPGWKQTIHPKEVRELFSKNGNPMARSTFWGALHSIKEQGLIDFAEQDRIEVFRPSPSGDDGGGEVSEISNDRSEFRTAVQNFGRSDEILNDRSPNQNQGKASSTPSTLFNFISPTFQEGASEKQDDSDLVGLWILARETRNQALISDLKMKGQILPWRLEMKNSNAPRVFNQDLLKSVLKHLKTTSMGENANLVAAARWVSLRELTAEGLREINTFWESCKTPQPLTLAPQSQAPASTSQPIDPFEAAQGLYNALQKLTNPIAKGKIASELKAQISRVSPELVPAEWNAAVKEVGHAA